MYLLHTYVPKKWILHQIIKFYKIFNQFCFFSSNFSRQYLIYVIVQAFLICIEYVHPNEHQKGLDDLIFTRNYADFFFSNARAHIVRELCGFIRGLDKNRFFLFLQKMLPWIDCSSVWNTKKLGIRTPSKVFFQHIPNLLVIWQICRFPM